MAQSPLLAPISFASRVALALIAGLTVAPSWAEAASLQQVQDWDKTGFPSDVSMYAYVPDQVVENPPLLLVIHYCGGTAQAVFGQAQGGGLVRAADEYGFVMVLPSSGRCWDVVSDKTRTREGKGDSHAIRSMVAHAAERFGVNLGRVYATGDSSGGMMTELLLGVYPDVFVGGSAMAGMPAACRGDNESGNGSGYSGACAGGNVSRSSEAWGDLVRSLSPDYEGKRPRVQLFHGDKDDIINYKNHTEALKEWTNVLGLAAEPDEEIMNVAVGTHQATRQTWKDECDQPVLDGFTSHGGDHGPSDALFLAQYIVPFLALDQSGPTDPVVAGCEVSGSGGAGSGGQSGGLGGGMSSGVGGADGSDTGGAPGALGGAQAAGGAVSGGATSGGASSGGAAAGAPGSPGASGGALATSGGSPAGQDDGAAGGPSGASGGCSFHAGALQLGSVAWLGSLGVLGALARRRRPRLGR